MTDTASLNLATLIQNEKDKTGASYMDIARKSGLSKAKIGQLAKHDSRHAVRAETVEKLARGLGLPLAMVQRAAMTTAGLVDVDSDKSARIDYIATQLGTLDDDTLELIAVMINAAVNRKAKD